MSSRPLQVGGQKRKVGFGLLVLVAVGLFLLFLFRSDRNNGVTPVGTHPDTSATSSLPTDPPPAGAPRRVDPTPPAIHGVIVGQVEGSGGAPLADALVELRSADGSLQAVALDEQAAFRIEGLVPGMRWLRAFGREHRPARLEVEVVAGDEARADFRLQARTLVPVEVIVADGEGGRACLEALRSSFVPVATLEPPRRFPWRAGGVRNPMGVGRFLPSGEVGPEVLMRGTLAIDTPLPVWVSLLLGDRVVEQQRVTDLERPVTFAVTETTCGLLASITCQIADASGRFVSGIRVTLASPSHAPTFGATDARGVVRFDQLVPGSYWLTLSAPGSGMMTRRILVEGGEHARCVVEWSPHVAVPIVLAGEYPRGAELTEGTTILLGADGALNDGNRIEVTSTDERFEMLFPRGRQLLRVAGSQWTSAVVAFDVLESGIELTVPVFRPRTLTVAVRGERWLGLHLEVQDTRGIVLHRAPLPVLGPAEVMLPPGVFDLAILDGTGVTLSSQRVEIDREDSVASFELP